MELQTFVIDIDDTISYISQYELNSNKIADYQNSIPIKPVIDKINKLYNQGHKIILFTSRGMRTFKGDIKKIIEYHKPILEKWLKKYNVKYHELYFGKPWGKNVRYVDDKNLTINQFIEFDSSEYFKCLNNNKSKIYETKI